MKILKSPIEKKISLFFLIALIVMIFAGILALKNKSRFIEMTLDFRRSFLVEKQLGDISSLVQRIELIELPLIKERSSSKVTSIDSLSIILSSKIDSLNVFTGQSGISKGDIDTLRHYLNMIIDLQKIGRRQFTLLGKDEDNNRMKINEAVVFSRIKNHLEEMKKKESSIFLNRSEELEKLEEEGYLLSILFFSLLLIFLTILMLKIRSELRIRIRTESELLMKSNELIHLNKSKDMLYSIIAHDLRSPFQPILTLAEIMHSDYETLKPEEIRDYAGKLNNMGRDVLTLLDNLLEWSKVQTGKLHFNPEAFMLKEKAEWAINNLLMSADSKRILLLNEIEENLWISADLNMILSIIQNLVSNAIKFTPQGGIIKVMSGREPKGTIISVKDNGVGMTPEQQKLLFKIGANISTSGTNRERGSGLGLLLCKELVEIHGGKIWVESVKGKGSTLSFSIPDRIK
ncbi:MAG: HAMP domain-containing sensor histidine kinase [Melioribacteraceae bacterium]